MTDKIQTRTDGAVQWLIFNQPEKHNALSLDMTVRALEVVEAFDRNDSLRVLVLAGAGEKAFVSGADISEFDKRRNNAETAAEYTNITNRMFDAIYETSKPTIAMINGYCFGGGVALAASCDLRYCSDDGLFSIPAARLGIGYRVSFTKRIVDLVGPAATREILFTARRYDAGRSGGLGSGEPGLPQGRPAKGSRGNCRHDRRECTAFHPRVEDHGQPDHRRRPGCCPVRGDDPHLL